MRILLFVFEILAFVAGLVVLASAKSAIHEIESFILFLIGAVFLSGAGVVEAVNSLRNDLTSPSAGTQMKKNER